MRRLGSLLGVALVVAGLGCSHGSNDTEDANPLTTGMCTADLVRTVIVEVRDMATGAPAACGASGEVRDSDPPLPLTDMGNCATAPETTVNLYGPYTSRGDRAALNYTVTIRKPGYQDWVRSQVVVTFEHCDVHTVTLQAFLEPE